MAYNQALADELRELLAGQEGVTEKRMFGGLAFLLNGNMAVAASHDRGLLVRVDPADGERHTTLPHVSAMEMRGRLMPGWLRVAPEALGDPAEMAGWVERSVAYARTLPPK